MFKISSWSDATKYEQTDIHKLIIRKNFRLTIESPKASTAWSRSSCMSSVMSGAFYND